MGEDEVVESDLTAEEFVHVHFVCVECAEQNLHKLTHSSIDVNRFCIKIYSNLIKQLHTLGSFSFSCRIFDNSSRMKPYANNDDECIPKAAIDWSLPRQRINTIFSPQ